MADFGGQIRFTYDGNSIRIRAKVEVMPGDFLYTAEENQDGTFDRYVQPKGASFDLEFVDSADGITPVSLPWHTIMKGGPYNVSILEDTNGVIHTLSNAKFIGEVKIDRLKGIVSGITVRGAVGSYKQLTT